MSAPVLEELQEAAAEVSPSDPCTIFSTSGTTGDPKGVVLTQGAVLATVHATREVLGWGLTETCGPATLNAPGDARFGTVGRPLPGIELRLDADGEVLVRGPATRT